MEEEKKTCVPFNPQPLDQLQARWGDALDCIYDAVEVKNGAIRPGQSPRNVFDFTDGLRLIASKERIPLGRNVLHVSASFRSGSILHHALQDQAKRAPLLHVLHDWLLTVPGRVAELAQRPELKESLGLVLLTNGVSHFIAEAE